MQRPEHQLNHDEAEEEAFLIKQKLELNQEPSEDGDFLKEQYQEEAEKIWKEAETNPEKPEIQLTPEQKIIKEEILFSFNPYNSTTSVIERFNLPNEIQQKIIKDIIIGYLAGEWGVNSGIECDIIYRIIDLAENYISQETINSPEIQKAVKEIVVFWLNKDESSLAFDLANTFHVVSSPEIQKAAKAGAARQIFENWDNLRSATVEKFNLPQETVLYSETMETYKRLIAENFNLKTIKDFVDFHEKNREYIDFLKKTPNEPMLLEKKDLPAVEKLHITFKEAEELKRNGVDLLVLDQEEKCDELSEKLKVYCSDWRDKQNIVEPFEQGQEIFGAEKMFAYLDRPGLSRHDGLHAFGDIIKLCEASGLTPEQFYGNILAQVNRDDSNYESGTAHHQLNGIAQTLDTNIGAVLEQAQKYKDINRLQELTEVLDSPKAVFGSWSNLKRFSELTEILKRAEILDQLKELKQQGKDKLYNYIETLAFHPSSKVDMQKVFEFWRDPGKFLAGNDNHTPEEVHDRKKPSNYVEIPNLDLTAEELRDALVEGKMDSLQAFTPMEIEYRLSTGETNPLPLREQIKTALGSFKEKIQGEAKDPKKLFSELQKVFKKYKLSFQDYLNGADLPEEKGKDIEKEITDLVNNPEIGLSQTANQEQVFVARINRKSDPEGVLAGNDTSCCMPFGAGKNTVYTFNPDTSLFTLQIKRPDGTLRTIAQSVLTKDKDVGILVPEILERMQQVGEKIDDLVSEKSIGESPAYLACDNVEVAPNFKIQEYTTTIEQIYRDFFAEYMKRFASEQGLTPNEVIIGQGYSDSLTHLPTKANTFVPLAPVGYSDKTHPEVYSLDLTKQGQKLKRKITFPEVAKPPQTPLPDIKGLSYLTFQDTLPVAYLEGKAYSDNESLLVYLHNIENGLIAKDINNSAKGRQNMSLKFVDGKGKMRSYMVAFEGKLNGGNKENEDDEYGHKEEASSGERIIYIEDFASDRKSPLASGKLLRGFTELYKANYLDKDQLVPIYAEAREQTSYALIKKHLDDMARDLGIKFELEELETYQAGNDTMHPVMIRPKKAA